MPTYKVLAKSCQSQKIAFFNWPYFLLYCFCSLPVNWVTEREYPKSLWWSLNTIFIVLGSMFDPRRRCITVMSKWKQGIEQSWKSNVGEREKERKTKQCIGKCSFVKMKLWEAVKCSPSILAIWVWILPDVYIFPVIILLKRTNIVDK